MRAEKDDTPDVLIARLVDQITLHRPGTTMYLVLHTGEEGLVPPPLDSEGPDGFSVPGTGSGHTFGPFLTEEEAEAWQDAKDREIGPCSCRQTIIEVIVPRIIAICGPATLPAPDPGRKDRLN